MTLKQKPSLNRITQLDNLFQKVIQIEEKNKKLDYKSRKAQSIQQFKNNLRILPNNKQIHNSNESLNKGPLYLLKKENIQTRQQILLSTSRSKKYSNISSRYKNPVINLSLPNLNEQRKDVKANKISDNSTKNNNEKLFSNSTTSEQLDIIETDAKSLSDCEENLEIPSQTPLILRDNQLIQNLDMKIDLDKNQIKMEGDTKSIELNSVDNENSGQVSNDLDSTPEQRESFVEIFFNSSSNKIQISKLDDQINDNRDKLNYLTNLRYENIESIKLLIKYLNAREILSSDSKNLVRQDDELEEFLSSIKCSCISTENVLNCCIEKIYTHSKQFSSDQVPDKLPECFFKNKCCLKCGSSFEKADNSFSKALNTVESKQIENSRNTSCFWEVFFGANDKQEEDNRHVSQSNEKIAENQTENNDNNNISQEIQNSIESIFNLIPEPVIEPKLNEQKAKLNYINQAYFDNNTKSIIKKKPNKPLNPNRKSVTFFEDKKFGFQVVDIPKWQEELREPVYSSKLTKNLPEWRVN
jgi:hypothetical protein